MVTHVALVFVEKDDVVLLALIVDVEPVVLLALMPPQVLVAKIAVPAPLAPV